MILESKWQMWLKDPGVSVKVMIDSEKATVKFDGMIAEVKLPKK